MAWIKGSKGRPPKDQIQEIKEAVQEVPPIQAQEPMQNKEPHWQLEDVPIQTEIKFRNLESGELLGLHEAICELLNRTE